MKIETLPNGNKYTYIKGNRLHSFDNQHAIVKKDGTKIWYQNGNKHRNKRTMFVY